MTDTDDYADMQEDRKKIKVSEMYEQNKMLLPVLPHEDDFIRIMDFILDQGKWFGIPTTGRVSSGVWSIVMLGCLSAIVIGAIIKVIRALAGWAVDTSGGRSVIGRLSGSIFYGNCLLSLLLTWKLKVAWQNLSLCWIMAENTTGLQLPPEPHLKRNLIYVIVFIAVCACGEHAMSMISAVAGQDVPPSQYFQVYILNSHGFLLRPTDYSLWVAIPIFIMSKTATIIWNLQDLIIILFSVGLASRYNRLNKYVKRYCELDGKEKQIKFENEAFVQIQNWRKIREAFVRQAALVRKINTDLGGLILLSSYNNFYFICLQLFLGIGAPMPSLLNRMYYIMSLLWLIFRACSVVLAAGEINVKSQKALAFLRNCPCKKYNVEVQRLEKQLSKDFVAFTGMGFYYLDRNMLLKVTAAIMTYELVLIQFDKN